MDQILVVNMGSSSLKFGLFDGQAKARWRGQIDAMATSDAHLQVAFSDPVRAPIHRPIAAPDPEHAIEALWTLLEQLEPRTRLLAVGHRVVHGGTDYREPVRLSDPVVARLRALVPLAPLHQPWCLQGIESVSRIQPDLPQVACFDTAFHHSRPLLERRLALPDGPAFDALQSYGFHGLSYHYIATRLSHYGASLDSGRVVVAHLGNGASLCALQAGQSVATTMSFTPLDGLPMATRSGHLDPSVVFYLHREQGLGLSQIEDLLNHRSGLLALSGLSGDVRMLEASEDPRAALALDYFVHHTAKAIASMAAVLHGLDALVFSAGIGEHSAALRARIVEHCAWLGLRLDPQANQDAGPLITHPDSPIPAWIIPTDEARIIAQQTLNLMKG